MTYSLLAKDPETGFLGLVVASRFFAVGALCPWSEGATGAVMTQALVNPELGPNALQLLRHGHRVADVRDMLIAQDEGRDQRQLHLIDIDGNTAAHTGKNCVDWFGHINDQGLSVAGNMLAGEAVIQATFDQFRADTKAPIVDRLINAMQAGEDAGGDKRGRQSIALRIQGPECYPRLDMRVDDHHDPITELRRIYGVACERFIPFSAGMPRAGRPYGILDRTAIEHVIERDHGKPFQGDVALN